MNQPSNNLTPPAPSLWPGPRLLVPVTLDILLIGQPNQSGDWADLSVSYQDLIKGGSATKGPFTSRAAPGVGAHLMWTLPSALRHGEQGDGGDLDFPLVPNRWAVMRVYTPGVYTPAGGGGATQTFTPDGKPTTLTAWVLQSDYLAPLSSAGGSQYPPDPKTPTTARVIGQSVTLGNWKETPGPAEPFLKAVGPGDVSWSATHDNVQNVFAFYDNLPDGQQGSYTYMVTGWYAAPGDDLLFGKSADDPNGWTTQVEWQSLMDRFQWGVCDLPKAESDWKQWQAKHGSPGGTIEPEQFDYPAQILCHGMVFNVPWQGTGYSYPSGRPGGGDSFPKVAVGNTGAEAISAWMSYLLSEMPKPGQPDPDIERILEAFQKDLVFEFTDDMVAFESTLQTARFGSSYAGTEWLVVRPDDAENKGKPAAGNQSVPLTPAQTKLLTDLNSAQAILDGVNQTLGSQSWELYSAYWKFQKVKKYPTLPLYKQTLDTLNDLKTRVAAGRGQLPTLQRTVDGLKSQLVAAVGPPAVAPVTLPDPPPQYYVVKNADRPSFWQPVDPVVMVAGAKADPKLGDAAGNADGDGLLHTRFTGQNINGLSVSYTVNGNSVTQLIQAADLLSKIALPTGGPLPKEMPDLWTEALFLDPAISSVLAQIFFSKAGITPTAQQLSDLAAYIAKLQTLGANNPSVADCGVIAEAAGLQGTLPSGLSVEGWAPPWTPIYMDWSVEWHYTSSDPTAALDGWSLGEIDFEWQGTSVTQGFTPYRGRTVLNSKMAQGLSQKLQKFLHSSPNLKMLKPYQLDELRQIAGKLSQFDILTQDMSGLTQQMLMRQPVINQEPTDPAVAPLLTTTPTYEPLPGTAQQNKPPVEQPFYPIRSGHLKITELWIVDAYGQILRGSPKGVPVQPYRAESVATPGDDNAIYVQLPPRYSQSANLNFRLLQATDDAVLSNSSDLTSPICGWVLPNHLDFSLTVFDSAGNNQGSVMYVDKDSGSGLRWEAVPGSDAPLGAPPNLSNEHLQGFVLGLLREGMTVGGDALKDLLARIDSTSWTTDPLGQQQLSNLAVLVGRPLAVVRAGVNIAYNGDPAYDQNWYNTGKRVTKGFDAVKFPVRIGDTGFKTNGVMGYFVNDDYTRFYPVHGSSPVTADLRLAVAQGPAQRQHAVLQIAHSLSAAAGAAVATVAARAATAGDDPYIVEKPLISLAGDGKTVDYLTILLDPRGEIPAISGIFPAQSLTLPPGPTTQALSRMAVTFRVGPVLTDPQTLRMPLPAEIRGSWSWVQRTGVTVWQEEPKIAPENPVARLSENPLRLSEGWLKLSGAETA